MITKNILRRLSIIPLLRFRSVSKQWHSPISSSHFSQTHFKSSCSSTAETLIIQSDNRYNLFSYENGEQNLVNIGVDFDADDENLVLVGSCNGLVCLGSYSGRLFIIWNPITREFRKYFDYEISSFHNLACMVTWGFGYVSAIDDYRVVRICKMVSKPLIRVHVFSINSNKWTRIDDNSSHDFSYLRTAERLFKQGVLVNESLYWMGGPAHTIGFLNRKILSFELGVELFNTFPHLDVSTPSTWGWLDKEDEWVDEFLCVIRGCLSKYGRLSESGRGAITILKHPGETEQISIDIDLDGFQWRNFIGFTSRDKVFALCSDSTNLRIVKHI